MTFEKLELLINGQWTQGRAGKSEPVLNPATEDVLGELPHASKADLDEALESSAEGFKTWRSMSAIDRQVIMEKTARLIEDRKTAIATNLTLEMGKPLGEATMEVDFAIAILRWYGEEGKRAYGRLVSPRAANMRQSVIKEPVGPVVGFVAWNFPAVNVMRKVAGALGAGCSITLKASEETPATCIAIARCFMEAGLPAGVLNLVFGVPDEISRHLLASSIPQKMSFTGSIPVGKHLQKLAADTMKRCTMELGGHSPFIVFDDVDVNKVAKIAAVGKFRNAGQVCVSPTRFYIHEHVYEHFVDAFTKEAQLLMVGNGMDHTTNMGPLVAERRLAIMEDFVADAKDSGAELLTGGQRSGNQGYFFAPTVLKDVPETARIMNEEPFGPIAPVSSFRDFDEVLAKANGLPFGLASYAFTNDSARTAAISEQIEAGLLAVNSIVVSTPETPFGGIKESGFGSEGGIEGLDAYLRTKFVTETSL